MPRSANALLDDVAVFSSRLSKLAERDSVVDLHAPLPASRIFRKAFSAAEAAAEAINRACDLGAGPKATDAILEALRRAPWPGQGFRMPPSLIDATRRGIVALVQQARALTDAAAGRVLDETDVVCCTTLGAGKRSVALPPGGVMGGSSVHARCALCGRPSSDLVSLPRAGHASLAGRAFDLLLVDECSQVTDPQLLVALSKLKGEGVGQTAGTSVLGPQLVLVGDPLQLPPSPALATGCAPVVIDPRAYRSRIPFDASWNSAADSSIP